MREVARRMKAADSPEEEAAARTARKVLEEGGGRPTLEMPADLRFLAERELEQDRKLKLAYATWLRWLLVGQLVTADLVFTVYAWAGRGWHLDTSVIDAWLGATVVQVVGIVLVVTRHLFPQRDKRSAPAGPEPT
jgi:hypothetical protein